MKKNIGILYICTGPYASLFKDFYSSFKKYFLVEKGYNVKFYIWTDSQEINSSDEISVYPHKYAGFPWDTLLRYDMFLEAKNDFQDRDYLLFFNANALFIDFVGEEILPQHENEYVAMSWNIHNDISFLQPYELDKKSRAYIPPFVPPYKYYSGQFNGGTKDMFIKLMESCAKNTHIDINNGMIAKSLDQDYLNQYLHYKHCRDLPREYMLPQEFVKKNEKPKIIFRTKDNKIYNKPLENKSLLYSMISKIRHLRDIICYIMRISVKSEMSRYIDKK